MGLRQMGGEKAQWWWGKGTQSVGKHCHVDLMVVLWEVLRAVE